MGQISLKRLVRIVLQEYKLQEEESRNPETSTAAEIRELVRQYRERESGVDDEPPADNL